MKLASGFCIPEPLPVHIGIKGELGEIGEIGEMSLFCTCTVFEVICTVVQFVFYFIF